MPALIIQYSYGHWYASASNSDGPGYYFAGATDAEQFAQVQALRNFMSQGTNAVRDNLPTIFDRVQPGQEGDVMTELFVETDELIYGTQAIEVAEGSDLFADIVQVALDWIL